VVTDSGPPLILRRSLQPESVSLTLADAQRCDTKRSNVLSPHAEHLSTLLQDVLEGKYDTNRNIALTNDTFLFPNQPVSMPSKRIRYE
jgi:hypothetical protein